MKKLIMFLNEVDSGKLCKALDELDKKITEIFKMKEASIEERIVDELKDADPYFFVWFCFLRANFLRGSDVVSNKRFISFLNGTKDRGYYFKGFPDGNLLPHLRWQYAKHVERMLSCVRENFSSGYKFVSHIKQLVDGEDDPLLLYLTVVGEFKTLGHVMGRKGKVSTGISNKIANAAIGEIGWELSLLRRYGYGKTVERLLNLDWIRKLFFASFFNVMIDIHVKNFFERNLNFKDVDQYALLLIAKYVKKDVINRLFKRSFSWVPGEYEKPFFDRYVEFVGANLIEKMIWMAMFVKNNSPSNWDIKKLKFFEISENHGLKFL